MSKKHCENYCFECNKKTLEQNKEYFDFFHKKVEDKYDM